MANEMNNLVVRLSLDNVNFRQGIANSGRAVRTLQNELKSVSTGMGGFANASQQTQAKMNTLSRLIEAQKEKVRALRQAYDQNKAKLGENDAATQRYASQVNKAVADLNRFENELKQVNRQAEQKGMDKLNNSLKSLQAEFQSITTGMGGFSNATEQTRAKVDVLSRMVDKQKEKIRELQQAYNRAKTEEGEASQSAQRYAEQIHRATGELNRFENELRQSNHELEQQGNRLLNFGTRMETLGNHLQNAGMQIGMVFGGMTYAIGRGLKSAVEESMNFEQQMANVKAVSGSTGEEMKKLSELAVNMGETTKYSSVQAGQGIEELIKAGVSLTDIINGGLEGALNLATAGELELGEAAEIASTALNAFKADHLSVADAANILSGAANASATDVRELKYGLSASSAVAAGAGMTFKDTATTLAVFAQNGLKGSDAGTSLKTMLMRLNPTTKEAYNQMRDLGLITYNAQAGYDFLVKNGIQPASRSVGDIEQALEGYVMKIEGAKKWNDKCDTTFRELATSSAFLSSKFYDQQGHIQSLENISGTLHESMKDLTDQQRSMALETLFGSDAVRGATILFKEGANGVNSMWDAMSKVTAAEVAATKIDTLKGRLTLLDSAFSTMKKTIGDALAPVVSVFVAGLQKLVDGFNSLPGPVQKAIAITGGIVLALTAVATVIGVIMGAIGMVVSGIGSLAIAMGVATAATSVTGAALGILTAVLGPVAIALGVVAAAVGVGVLAYKGYQKATEDSITSVDRFATNNKLAQDEYQKALASSDAATKKYMKQQTGEISSSTKKVLGDYFKLSDGIRQKLTEIKLNHEVMTTEQAQKLGQQYDQLTEKIITKVDERKQKETERLRKLFADSYVLTSEEENKRLELLNQKYEDEKIKVAEKNQKIKEINDLAASEHREKTHSENVAIQALQDEMDRIAVQHMTQNQMEQKVILENMRVQASEISARQAAEVVENSAKTRDKVIKDAEKTRNDKIAEAIRQRDEMGSLNAQEAEAVIAEAKRQYDSTVSTARDKHKEIVSEAKSQAGEHANQVDWETGQIKSKYQVMKDDVVQKMKETWSGITKWWEETKTSASNKVEEIKNTVSRKFEEKKKAVVDKMKEIKSDIEDKWNTVEKFFSTINLRSIGKSIIEGLEKGLDDATDGLYSKAKGIAGEIKKTISGALEINSPSKVMIPVGSAVPEDVGVGMDKGKRFVVDAAKNVVGTVKKQMGNMPSVFDFGFQTSHYIIPHNTIGDFDGYTQLQSPYNNAPTAKTMFSDRSGREQELNVTVNMTNVLDGKELANGSYAYTTKLQDRDQKRRAEF
ncbi:phage tail tape measure protein [Bacillus cereus]|uniref:Phage tail tape measure protein, TP901 family, core region n=4 Tax=Bacillus cereus group TaxID=86661 RepID=A0A9W5KWA7_BACCE|nr:MULTISPECIES: phage tail tape measure protein [Bacillus cereus group]MEB8747043.1 phage tail tape measure protein [Bacillus cereus]EJR71055.1 phage tail tape measure protein, TP901 family, core region [Bacillus cereus VD154]KIU73497.1 phage tail tape measure protein, family [Bacillus thuringiensis Sbt003]MEB8762686.1 phage tail tape measure protein [Bacillus cereus]MEB8894408.1 phage tail tape measure protein [Bacillus cereus]